ncbi:MAG: type II restriction endonuclease, partial [Bacteroidales bacterium]
MKKLCQLLNLSDEDKLFEYINNSFRNRITTFDYFVNWKKVFDNIKPIEKELNLLNVLVGKENIEQEIFNLIKEYPNVVKAFPFLIASRENSFDVFIDVKKFISKTYDFSNKNPTNEQIRDLSNFVLRCGLADILKNKQVKNLVDYSIGVEVGLDSNGRKNRSGTMMEGIVEVFVEEFCQRNNAHYMPQATARKIGQKWGLSVAMDKSSRIIDFAINKDNKLFLIEVNFYSGGGSKLKSTATEYCEMYDRYHKQGIEFIWITDGAGWYVTQKPLREYFDKSDYLLNLEMLRNGVLMQI